MIKNSGLYGIRTLDPCDTGAALYQLSLQANWQQVYIGLFIINNFNVGESCDKSAEKNTMSSVP